MQRFDVFNGDGDGLCALQQLRLAEGVGPGGAEGELVTGVKRDIRLLAGLVAPAGSLVTVLDVGFVDNRADVERLLEGGCRVRYFDHHFAGEVPLHPALETHLDAAPDVCTSLLVHRFLQEQGRHSAATGCWAVAGAFGDNMAESAIRAAEPLGRSATDLEALRELGELLNYNGYGESTEDLHFHPAHLFRALAPHADPLAFAREGPEVATLREGFADDLARAEGVGLQMDEAAGRAVVLPDAPWARRIQGVLANRLAREAPQSAHAVATTTASGDLKVSVRAPLARPQGAGGLCRQFSGGGREGAGGINALPPTEWERFLEVFRKTFG